MLSDRSYMHRAPGGNTPSFLAWFLGVLAGVFVLQAVLTQWFGSDGLFRQMVLSGHNLRDGRVWTPLSYAFLHSSLLHLLLNLGGAYILIRRLEESLSPTRLLTLSLASALGGAALWLGFHFNDHGHLIGASAVVMGYFTVFVCMAPDEQLALIPLSRRWLLLVLGGLDLLGLLAWELPRGLLEHNIAHSAHLGGVAAGWLFHRLAIASPRIRSAPSIEPPAWARKASARPGPAYTVNLDSPAATSSSRPASPTASRDALKAEVDRILDKINLHGFGALSEAEKRVLDEARQQLSHR